MADIRKLVRLLNELDEELVCCTRCGMCQAACPLYGETGRETDVARGKLVLVENLSKEILDNPEAVKERLDRCLLCGSCEAACPSGVKILDIFLKARAIITGYLGLSPVKKAVFRGFLSNPERFDRLLRWMARFQGPFSKQIDETLGSSCARFMSPVIGDRHYLPLAKTAWHKQAHRQFKQPEKKGPKIAFYPGCLIDEVLPRVGDAAMRVFDHHQVDVFVADQVPCCGIPALAAGDRQTFEQLVKKNIRIFESAHFDYLITPCATCTATIKKLWPLMTEDFPAALREKVLAISEKTRDINEFLVDVINIQPIEDQSFPEKRVTYHDPCHLKKSLGIFSQPRAVLSALPDWEFVEMREADRCCGMGGSFNLQHYDISRKIGQKKSSRIIESGADAVATGCPACMMQITDLLSHAGRGIAVKHPVELYAEALDKTGEAEAAAHTPASEAKTK
ncbi:MAG TPA: (Fe-S)-binding protein [Desulfosalsimonadaceae bacterium]|nr:(Fe-S)-binding protein [Desulfosalsimonadaceae bacterium]